VDDTKTFQKEYGFAYTDSTGYFLINFAGSAPGGPTSAPQLYVEIVNASGKPIYISTEIFAPAAGSTTYQNITLPASEKPIGNPPPAIRLIKPHPSYYFSLTVPRVSCYGLAKLPQIIQHERANNQSRRGQDPRGG